MPMHPAAPDDRNGLIDAFDHSVQSIIDLGHSCRDEDFELQTECPGWTVKDQIAHVVGAEKSFAGMPRPQVEVPDYPHVHSDFARFVEVDVEARRSLSGREVVAELAEFHPQRVADLRASDADIDTVIGGFFGPETTFGDHLHRRIVDAWVHEQDLRAALDRPGNLDSASAAVFTADILAALPRIASRVAGVGAGHAVVLDVSGPVVARGGVRIITGNDGRPYGEALFSGIDRPEGEEQLDVTSIHLTTDALTRRAAGRRGVDEIHYTVTGDEEIARKVLEALVVVTH
ncbi:maleylpyruvate isomerase family mycothiol-dependent enzyme [Terrabacter sp. Soil810]|uniref:maleylpyruvate isomerase family mycothiol-dependent enzyme n=1 Tax=Terrabacter sp. Soil810 TaxID=1736418 RepID=UPI000AE746AD|nr:maleylpyruvate isomerase family mycothiol-dependent enzyme [Terrabacter sp. Soil810]